MTGDTEATLRATIPDFIPVSNPMDLTAQALVDPDLYRRALEPLLADPAFGSVVLGIIQTDEATSRLKFEPIIRAIEALQPEKPVVFAGLDEGAPVPPKYIDAAARAGRTILPIARSGVPRAGAAGVGQDRDRGARRAARRFRCPRPAA